MLKVVAIGIIPRIDEVERDRIQELLDGTHPMSPYRKTYDTGTKRKTVLDQSPMGPNEIVTEQGDRGSHDNVGSGYKQGPNAGGRADDETGPGNTSDPDPEQDFASHDTADLAFHNDFDTSSKWSPLNYGSHGRDARVTDYLLKLHRRPGVGAIPQRHEVDELAQSKSGSSNWSCLYRV